MSATTIQTTGLPEGFARTGKVWEPMSDGAALPLIEIANTHPDGEERRKALSTLGHAGIFCALDWVPLARKTPAPVALAEAVAPFVEEAKYEDEQRAAGKIPCAPGRQRHRYTPGGACRFCPARDPRSVRAAQRGSLADSIKITPLEQPARQPEASTVAGTSLASDPSNTAQSAAAGPAPVELAGGTHTVPAEPDLTPAGIPPAEAGLMPIGVAASLSVAAAPVGPSSPAPAASIVASEVTSPVAVAPESDYPRRLDDAFVVFLVGLEVSCRKAIEAFTKKRTS